MFQKGNRYLADWYDRKGNRRRKSFTTPEAAQAYEDVQRSTAHPKALRESKQLRKPSRNLRSTNRRVAALVSPQKSSKSMVPSSRAISKPNMSPCSTRGSKAAPTASRVLRTHKTRQSSCDTCMSTTTQSRCTTRSCASSHRNRETSRQRRKNAKPL